MPSYSLSFTARSDANVWFANAAAFNNWMASIRVTIPDASTGEAGVMKKLDFNDYTPVTLTSQSMTIQSDQDGDGLLEDYSALDKSVALQLIAEVNRLSTTLANLITELKNL